MVSVSSLPAQDLFFSISYTKFTIILFMFLITALSLTLMF